MNIKIKTLFVLLSMTCFHMSASEFICKQTFFNKAFGWIGQSRLVCLFEKYITSKTRGNMKRYLDGKPASEEYQNLGKKAQLAVGIQEKNLLPIKKIPLDSPFSKIGTGFAEPDAIYINEEELKEHGKDKLNDTF